MIDASQVEALLQALDRGTLSRGESTLSDTQLDSLGLTVGDGGIGLPAGMSMLRAAEIQAGLDSHAAAWLKSLTRFPVIGSTNTWLMEAAAQGSIDGWAALAECQLAGRGRRGRGWASPLGANLAISLGFALRGSVAQLNGLSLVVGLAVVDALDPQGTLGIQLTWPNDVLVGNRKLAGILVEVALYEGVAQVCIGVGVNWLLPSAVQKGIDQPVIDMSELDASLDRNTGASRLISRIVEYVNRFAQDGLEPMRATYDKVHAFHGRRCRLLQSQGELIGEVLGISAVGELRLQTADGPRSFTSGEVSLRPG